jgi:hypothetical protein
MSPSLELHVKLGIVYQCHIELGGDLVHHS